MFIRLNNDLSYYVCSVLIVCEYLLCILCVYIVLCIMRLPIPTFLLIPAIIYLHVFPHGISYSMLSNNNDIQCSFIDAPIELHHVGYQ